jgi:hypothetical protein
LFGDGRAARVRCAPLSLQKPPDGRGARFGLADRNRERPVSETRVTFLGAITVDPDKTIAFDIPPDADADAIRAALAAAEEERAAAQAREAKRLREIFLEDERR